MPVGGLLVGVTNMQHGGFIPQRADNLQPHGQAPGIESAADGKRRMAGGVEAPQ